MAFESVYYQEASILDFVPVAAVNAGDVIHHKTGLAGVVSSYVAASGKATIQTYGIVKMAKTASIVLLQGGDVYWDVSAGKAHFRPEAGTPDFFVGTVETDAASADTEVYVMLNRRAKYDIDLAAGDQEWTSGTITGTSHPVIAMPGGGVQLDIATTNEAAATGIVSQRTVPVSAKGIAEFRLASFVNGTTVLDVDFGIMDGTHASDFDSVAVFATFHFDAGDLNIDTQSDDGSTDRAIADSTIDHVDDTYGEYWIDYRDDTNVLFYVNGVVVDTSSTKRILTAALATAIKLGIYMEKTSSAEQGQIKCTKARLRTFGE